MQSHRDENKRTRANQQREVTRLETTGGKLRATSHPFNFQPVCAVSAEQYVHSCAVQPTPITGSAGVLLSDPIGGGGYTGGSGGADCGVVTVEEVEVQVVVATDRHDHPG